MHYSLLFIAFLDFVGLAVSVRVLYLTRGARESDERISQRLERLGEILDKMDERSERLNFYLFSKLGPAAK